MTDSLIYFTVNKKNFTAGARTRTHTHTHTHTRTHTHIRGSSFKVRST